MLIFSSNFSGRFLWVEIGYQTGLHFERTSLSLWLQRKLGMYDNRLAGHKLCIKKQESLHVTWELCSCVCVQKNLWCSARVQLPGAAAVETLAKFPSEVRSRKARGGRAQFRVGLWITFKLCAWPTAGIRRLVPMAAVFTCLPTIISSRWPQFRNT